MIGYKYGNNLSTRDEVKYGRFVGILLYNHNCDKYGIVIKDSMWYREDKYDINSYGNFIEIPMDNGARMKIEKM